MRFVRYKHQGDDPQYGWVNNDLIGPLVGTPIGEYRRLEAYLGLNEVTLCEPILPSKIICVGKNYEKHIKERDSVIPDYPILFMKPPSSVIGHNAKIILPPQSQFVHHEAELAVIIKKGRWIKLDQAQKFILGYTIANDITARDLQERDNQWTRAKGFDTFCPLGPWIETDLDVSDLMISCYVNDELRQMASTREMIFPVNQLVTFISSIMTLLPGDVILTGTPAGVGLIKDGDVVEIKIDGIGSLKNKVTLDEKIIS